ncbi:uncharacterized protein V1510DRAFT_415718 [Dipodascopsis tothii]|uniref:uncharacterized protein n=1 Tax=Dipodascopsis tothii TaxID=44089 RepID=UPI0034CF9B8F
MREIERRQLLQHQLQVHEQRERDAERAARKAEEVARRETEAEQARKAAAEQARARALAEAPAEPEADPAHAAFQRDFLSAVMGAQPASPEPEQPDLNNLLELIFGRQRSRSSSPAPQTPAPERAGPATPPKPAVQPLDAVRQQINVVRDKVKHEAGRVASFVEQARAGVELDPKQLKRISFELESLYSDLDGIRLESDGADADADVRHQLKLLKHDTTTMAVDAAEQIDRLLTPEVFSEPSSDDEQMADRTPAEPAEPIEPAEPALKTEPSSEPERVIDDGDFYMVETPGAGNAPHPVTVETADASDEAYEFLDEEEKNEERVARTIHVPVSAEPARTRSQSRHVTLETVPDDDAAESTLSI